MLDLNRPVSLPTSWLVKFLGMAGLLALGIALGFWWLNGAQRDAVSKLTAMGAALEFDDYRNVKSLRIPPGCSLKALEYVAALPRLETLTLPVTDATDQDLAPLLKTASIEQLILSGNPGITDEGLKNLVNLIHLKSLYLTDVPIRGPGLQSLGRLTNLDVLSLSYTKLEDSELAHLNDLKSLRVLDLSYTACSDEGLKHLTGLTSLKELWLMASKATPEGAAKLNESLPKVNVRFGL